MLIESGNIRLIALTYEQVEMYRHTDYRLEDSLGLKRTARIIAPQYSNALGRYTLNWMKDDPENWLFATVWIIVETASNSIAGELGFKRKADENGYIEIGYSVQVDYRNKGYITEAIRLLSGWAFTHPEVKAILAETTDDNMHSIKALQKNGFKRFSYSRPLDPQDTGYTHETDNMIWHKLEKPNNR
ncbi:MAG: GNAT family N-acetyltransferase [Ignavibacteria bacterium]|nr:GNAT family N-acetyltransferase [Ignavibacteria bacterium]